jgi:flagellar motility protein MotE (MotC chaperone)
MTSRWGKLSQGGHLLSRGWIARAPFTQCCAATKRLSIPLATAFVATLAMAGLLLELLAGERQTVFEPSDVPQAATARPAVVPGLASEVVPEPAAGPSVDSAPQTLRGRDSYSTGLPEIPSTPASLDDVARELRRRREEILKLEAALALREAAVRAAEADLEAQLRRLEDFQRELAQLVGRAEAGEEERLAQLVKMYESMRAKSAAAIFDRLELPVILAVAKRMREAKMAAILAAMDPNRARGVTAELVREQVLPQLE